MHGELVAIDLETTGFDPASDAIIEVGMVRIKDGQILEEFTKLIDPGRQIPSEVSYLTGIQQEDVDGQLKLEAVLPGIQAFAGNAPLIGHNLAFDTSFLIRHGILQHNIELDTYDLASILIPTAPRYNLHSLSVLCGVPLDNAHRALDDARASALLYWALWQKALVLPADVLSEIYDASQELDWDTRNVFEAALRERGGQPSPARKLSAFFQPDPSTPKPLQANETTVLLDPKAVTDLIDENGPLARNIPGYEHRVQQIEMTGAIVEAFNQSRHIMIEAGTGTGKSIAYLVPSILWSTTNNERVVVSTYTLNLQDQLVLKDLPALRTALGMKFDFAMLKGRGNYVCPRRFEAARRRRPNSVDELRTLAKILVWLLDSRTGDKGEISLRGPLEYTLWQRLSAEDENCTLGRCEVAMGGACPFYKARKAAEAAHVVVINHALLIADAMTDNRALPDYQYLILDEGHNLEEAVTTALSFRLDETALKRRLADLGGPRRGLLGSLLNAIRGHASEREVGRVQQFIEIISEATGVMEIHISTLFKAVRHFLNETGAGRNSDYSVQVRITEDLRAKPGFSGVQAAWSTLAEFFEAISEGMSRLTVALGKMSQVDIPDYDDLVNSAATASRYLEEVKAQLTAFAMQPDSNTIYWVTIGQDGDYLSIQSAPLHIGPMMEQYVWQSKEAVVMTSATLQTSGGFGFIRERLHAETVDTREVGSPFDYHDSTLVFIPNDFPEPSDRHRYQQEIDRGLIELATALEGRTLALFTSYTQLRQTAQAITPRLRLGGITVYDQSDGSSRQTLLDGFKSTEKAVLLGTRSFWEGVDIPGDSLSALVIVRLPFAVPTDPVFAARSDTYSNAFNSYALPDAILRFRQGFGRLIRTRTDRGIVAVFDSRIINKGYGTSFLDALPDCTVERGPLNTLPNAALKWLARP